MSWTYKQAHSKSYLIPEQEVRSVAEVADGLMSQNVCICGSSSVVFFIILVTELAPIVDTLG